MSHPAPEPARSRRSARPDEIRAERAASEALHGSPARAGLPDRRRERRSTAAPRAGGTPLEPGFRRAMEAGFGHDFGRVRVHDDATADRQARAEAASALTVGEHIYVREDRRGTGGSGDERLLAHELAHVAQQRAARTVLVQHQEDPDDASAEEPDVDARPVRMKFAVKINRTMDSDQLLVEFIKQYRGVATDAQAKRLREQQHWQWVGTPPKADAAAVARGMVLVAVRDQSLQATPEKERTRLTAVREGLGEEERRALDAEATRLLRERTHIGGPSSKTLDDRVLEEYRAELTFELLRQREALQRIPEDVRAILFTADPKDQRKPVQFREYGRVLALAERLTRLTPQQREEFLKRSTGRAADLEALETSVGRFEEEVAERRRMEAEQGSLESRLHGREQLYARYRQLVLSDALSAVSGLALGPLGASQRTQQVEDERRKLDDDLKVQGFAGIGEFAGLVRSYTSVFRAQAVALGHVLLDRFEHTLWEQERLLASTQVATDIHRRLGPAREALKAADLMALHPATRDSAAAKRAEAEDLVRKEAKDLPVLEQKSFDRKAFAEGSPHQAQRTAQDYIARRRSDVARAHRLLRENPDRVFSLDGLLKQAYAAQGVEAGSVFDSIVRDHALDLQLDDVGTQFLVGVVAIALGLLSGGTGGVAVVAASGAFALSAYQAFEEFRRYEESRSLHEAGLLSDDPSIAWAVVALVGAGLDMAAVGAALRSVGPAKVSLGKAVATFHETGDLARLSEQAAHASPKVRDAIEKAAAAQKKVWAAWARVLRPGGALYSDPFLIGAFWAPTIEAIWLTHLYGVRRFRQFLHTREARNLFRSEFTALAPGAQAGVRRMYDEVAQVVQRGESLGLRPDEIDHIILSWADRQGTPVTTVIREMDTYGEPLSRGRPARYRIASGSVMDEATRRVLPEFDWRIASTGAIRSIRAHMDRQGSLVVTIEGTLQPSLARSAQRARPDQVLAPNFNVHSSVLSVRELGSMGLPSPKQWQLLHLWGPGFGDEAAAGIMVGPRAVNQQWQNRGIEKFIRELRDTASREGGQVRLRATGVSWPDPTPKTGFRAPGGARFLQEAKYEITLELPGRPPATTTVSLHTAEPPASALAADGIDIVNAAGRHVTHLL
ncbi:DUF4157 domain-containing protein [Streptomyces sp. NPDC007808]|uniref:eCIS core domain-containing protein n=1 Tax=Streptomyces sp. NPDC007808 TaxID=3364779 RepID=UPI0036A2DEEC